MYNSQRWEEQVYTVSEPQIMLQQRLRELREEPPWESQTDVGDAAGVKQKVVSTWETGESRPTYEHLVLIARHFNVTTDYLLGVTSERQGKVRELSEEELKQRLFEYITPDHTPEILERIARFFEGNN